MHPAAFRADTWAGVGPRTFAAVVDGLILGIVWLIALFVLVMLLSATGGLNVDQLAVVDPASFASTDEGARLGLLSGSVLFALSGFYHVYAWSRMRATPGQQLLRLQVLDARTGGPIDTAHALIRWVVRDVPFLGPLLGVLILFWYLALAASVARSPARRGVHDVIARSVVVTRAAAGAGGTGRSQ